MGALRASRVGILRGPVRPYSGWPSTATGQQCSTGAVGWLEAVRRELCLLAETRRPEGSVELERFGRFRKPRTGGHPPPVLHLLRCQLLAIQQESARLSMLWGSVFLAKASKSGTTKCQTMHKAISRATAGWRGCFGLCPKRHGSVRLSG